MNILVITFPLFSHVEIANLISKYLKHRQTDVTYVVSENLEMLIKNPGCGKIVYQSYFRDFLYLKSSKKSFFEKKIYEFDNVLKQIYIKMVSFQPDLIIYDYESFWGKMFADSFGIPSFCYSCTFLPPPGMIIDHGEEWGEMNAQMEKISTKYNMPYLEFSQTNSMTSKTNFICIPEVFQPNRHLFDTTYIFNGFIIKETYSIRSLNSNKNIIHIYISLGTVYSNRNTISSILNTIEIGNSRIYLSDFLGNYDNIKAKSLEVRLKRKRLFNQRKILKITDVFISHGGINSICDAISCNVPLLLIPQNEEQRSNSEKCVSLGIGEFYNERTSISDQVLNLINDKSYKEKIKMLSAVFHENQEGFYRSFELSIQSELAKLGMLPWKRF